MAKYTLPEVSETTNPGTRTTFDVVKDFARAGGQGLTLGFGDEMEAVVRAGFDRNRSYSDIVKDVRNQISDFRKRNPKSAIGTEIAGAILPTIAAQFIPGAGQTASVANTARLANIAKGAGLAGAEGLVYGVGTAEGGLGERLTNPNTAISGATSAVLGGAVGGLAPKITEEAKELIQKGVQVTPGQAVKGSTLGGTTLSRLEEATGKNVFFLGDAITAAMKNTESGFNRQAVQEALDTINVKVPKTISGTRLIAFGQDVIDKKYKALLPKLSIKDSSGFSGAIANVINDLGEDIRPFVTQRVNETVINKIKPPPVTAALDGKAIKNAQTELRKSITNLRREATDESFRKADALDDIRLTISQQLQMETPELAKELAELDQAYGLFEIVRNASIRRTGNEGAFSPVDLLQEAKKADITKRKSNFSKGEARMQRTAQVAQDVIGNTVPDSGTSQRILASGVIGSLGNLASPGAVTSSVLPILGGGVAYSQPVLPLTRSLLGSGIQQGGMAAAPVAGAMTADNIRQMLADGLLSR